MKKEDAYYLGKIVKPYGHKGELLAKLDTDEPEKYEDLESVFLEIRGELVPFFLDKSVLHKSLLLRMKFEDVDSMEKAEQLVGRKLYLPLADLPELTGNNFYYHEIKDFLVIDDALGELGKLKGVNDYAPRPYFIVEHPSGKEILIPVHDDFIRRVERENRTLYLKTPPGLVDLFLSDNGDGEEKL